MAKIQPAEHLATFLRKKRGDLTYLQFARKVGISHSTLHRLEMGDQNITLATLTHLSERLKCSIRDFFPE